MSTDWTNLPILYLEYFHFKLPYTSIPLHLSLKPGTIKQIKNPNFYMLWYDAFRLKLPNSNMCFFHLSQSNMFIVSYQPCEQKSAHQPALYSWRPFRKINLVSCLLASQMCCDRGCFSHIVPNTNPLPTADGIIQEQNVTMCIQPVDSGHQERLRAWLRNIISSWAS